MGEAKRYRVTRERTVFDTVSVFHVAECASKFDAARIARLLNSEEEVRAALAAIIACEDGGSLDDAYYAEHDAAMSKVRAALSALDAGAVRP